MIAEFSARSTVLCSRASCVPMLRRPAASPAGEAPLEEK